MTFAIGEVKGTKRSGPSMFKPVKECGVVKSIKSCRHIESSENSNFARVYIFQNIVCKFEQSSFSWVELISSLGSLVTFHWYVCNCKVKVELTTEVVKKSFEGDGVMMRSSRDDRMYCESCRVGEFTSCLNEVELSSSTRSSSILSGEVPGKLRSPQIMSRSTVPIPRVARSEPNSLKNSDLLEEGGR